MLHRINDEGGVNTRRYEKLSVAWLEFFIAEICHAKEKIRAAVGKWTATPARGAGVTRSCWLIADDDVRSIYPMAGRKRFPAVPGSGLFLPKMVNTRRKSISDVKSVVVGRNTNKDTSLEKKLKVAGENIYGCHQISRPARRMRSGPCSGICRRRMPSRSG